MESAAPPPQAVENVSRLWWLWLVIGIVWVLAGLVILQFDQASVTTVGVIVGIMFWGAAVQNLVIGMLADRMSWFFYLFARRSRAARPTSCGGSASPPGS